MRKTQWLCTWFCAIVFLLSAFQAASAIRAIRGNRAGSTIFHADDGYLYHRSDAGRNAVYLKCRRYERGCLGRAVFHRDRGFRHTRPHNHHPHFWEPQFLLVRTRILERCRRAEAVTFQRIIREESRNCHPIVRALCRLPRMRWAMLRARRAVYPPIPQSLQELSGLLDMQIHRHLTMSEDGTDNLYAGSVTDRNGDHHVIFCSRRMLEFLRQTTRIHADGTFRSLPAIPNLSQVFVLVTTWNHHIIPIAWVIMESRTEVAYTAVLTLIRQLTGRNIALNTVITDWEQAQQNAWDQVFPQCRLQGCFWHYCRAILRYASTELHLTQWLRNDRLVRTLVRMCCALALLPVGFYQRSGLLLVMRIARNNGRFYIRLLAPFFLYLKRRWFLHRRRSQWLNFFRSFNRTNNACESHHACLNRLLGIRHPNIFAFLEAIVALEDTAYGDLLALNDNLEPSRRRRASAIANDRNLRALGRGLRHAPLGRNAALLRFLFFSNFTFRRFFNNQIFD